MNNRRRLWPILTVALVLLPVLYIASLGLASWLDARGLLPGPVRAALEMFYLPIAWLVHSDHCPGWVGDLMNKYIEFWYP